VTDEQMDVVKISAFLQHLLANAPKTVRFLSKADVCV
jgi:hypothetical protein